MKHAALVRRQLEVRTIMNLLGPCINPARPPVQLLGVADPKMLRRIAQTLAALGVEKALVVHGSGLDEVALHGDTRAIRLEGGEIEELQITPEDAGVDRAPLNVVSGGDVEENAARLKALLNGCATGPEEDIVILNTAALLLTAGRAPSLREGAEPGKRWSSTSRRAVAEPVGLLAEIAAAKRLELAKRYDGISIDALRADAQPTERSLRAVLAKAGARFILEIKKASPSSGAIRPSADPETLARGYAGVADALSVLCDHTYFGGSLADLSAARRHFDGPILAKDFFIDERQVPEARVAGADAVLVMLSLLDDERALAIIEEARRLNMDALVEVHDEREMQRAVALGAPLVGINNRDLRDLSIDLSTTERLARLAGDRVLVSESGITARADVDRLAPLVDGFLIGSSLMRAAEPEQAARELIFGRVKLCGLNCGASLCAARPAAFAGFVFVPGSPRHVTAQAAEPLVGTTRSAGIRNVGVFRNAPVRTIVETAALLDLHAVQLHGSESLDYVRELRSELGGEREIWTALSVGRDVLESRGGDRLLFDNASGGSGHPFDWALIENHPELPRAILAGGIGAANACEAAAIGCYAIDVGSSVDERPGTKSPEKIAELFDKLRPIARKQVAACV
jgi:indole-3-glycerol phosphate synthase/phosphoribosylanthranilate isomerase